MHPREAKITPYQLALLLIPGISSTAIIILPASMATFAQQDAWLGPLVALPINGLIVWIAGRLARRFPGETFIEYAPRVLGRVPGKIAGLLVFLYFFQISATIGREFSDFLVTTTMSRTPLPLVLGLAAFVTAMGVRYGPEALGRVSELFVPLSVLLIIVIIAMSYSHLDFTLLQPVGEYGFRPLLDAAFICQSFLGQLVMLLFLLPSVESTGDGVRAGYVALGVTVLTFSLVTATSIAALGPITPQFNWPFLKVARMASIGPVLTRIDPLMVGFWIGSTCMKLALHLYVAVISLTQLLGLSDFRRIVFPVAALVAVYGVGYVRNMAEQEYMLAYFWPPFTLIFQLGIPALVLIVAVLRGSGKEERRNA